MERMEPLDSFIYRMVKGENPAEQLDIISTRPRETGDKSLVHLAPDRVGKKLSSHEDNSWFQTFANFFSEPEEVHTVYLKYTYCLIKLFQASRHAYSKGPSWKRNRASTSDWECLVLVPTQTAQIWSCTASSSVSDVFQCVAYPALWVEGSLKWLEE